MVYYTESINYTTIPSGSFRISSSSSKTSKTIDFFEDLYSCPPKFRVKWNSIDELHEDVFMSYNYRLLTDSLPFLDVVKNFFLNEEVGTVKRVQYSLASHVEGYRNKVGVTRFYTKHLKKLEETLKTVPVYVILNGQGEIVLANSTDSHNLDSPSFKESLYTFCGSFDPLADSTKQLGLFFMSRKDAEMYLTEIAKIDTEGTKMLGLSIHCFGLDFAYRVSSEYHPTIDFRFVPDLSEVQSLLTSKQIGGSNLIFENNQQQIRVRKNLFSMLPGFQSGSSLLPSFIQKTDYFKGVPIYVVTLKSGNNNFVANHFSNIINGVDTIYSKALSSVSTLFGFGNNLILEGSVKNSFLSSKNKIFIFFDKKSAIQFAKRNNGQLNRYNCSNSNLFGAIAKKSSIFVHNLEDFLEMLEEQSTLSNEQSVVINNLIRSKNIHFIPSELATVDVTNLSSLSKKSTFQSLKQFISFKCRRLAGFFEILLSTN